MEAEKENKKSRETTVEQATKTAAKTAEDETTEAKAENANSLVDNMKESLKLGSDVFNNLRRNFKVSEKTVKESAKFQRELEKLKFTKFKEDFSFKSLKGMPIKEFKGFADRLQKRFELLDDVKNSLLDGLIADENQEMLKSFHFDDGKGNIRHGRFITLKRNDKMDVAYAVYTLSFELVENEISELVYELLFHMVPVSKIWSYKKEAPNLTEGQKNKFSQWCEVKLFNSFQEKFPKE